MIWHHISKVIILKLYNRDIEKDVRNGHQKNFKSPASRIFCKMLGQVKAIILVIIYWKFQKTSDGVFKGLIIRNLPGRGLK